MRLFNTLIFDSDVAGTSSTWYSPATHNAPVGAADVLAVQVLASSASGSSPTVTVRLQHSGNNEDWADIAATPQVNAQPLTSGANFYAPVGVFVDGANLAYVRAAVSLGGTSPKARLKIFVCGRDF